MEAIHTLVLEAYDRMIGLELSDLAVDGCLTVAPCGGEVAGRSPVNRGRQGFKRSLVVDASGIPLGTVAAPANRPDSPVLEATLDTLDRLGPLPNTVTVHLDRGYDSGLTRQRLAARGLQGEIAPRGKLAPLTAGQRWVDEREDRNDGREHHMIRIVERLPVGLSWQQQADRIAEIIATVRERNREVQGRNEPGFLRLDLVVDATGGGSAMVDLLRERRLRPVAVTITATDRQVNHEDGTISAGKGFLISRLQAWLEDRIHLPQTSEADVLIDELQNYQIDVTPAGHATFSARSGKHDDLVLALALAVAVDLPEPEPFILATANVPGRW
jgi:hypothetical protein